MEKHLFNQLQFENDILLRLVTKPEPDADSY